MSYEASKIGHPWKGYYLSAYGIAVKHGFVGTEEEWLEFLKGKSVELRYNTETDTLQWRHQDTEEAWMDVLDIATLQGVVVAQTLKSAQEAADTATQAQSAAQSANTDAQGAATSAAQSAQTAAEKAGVALHPPITQGGTWWTWDSTAGAYADTGLAANVSFEMGTVTTVPYDQPAAARNVGTDNHVKLELDLPQGQPGGADLLLSNLSDPAAARWNLGAAGNTNLLDNWYFPAASVIDQRQGYVAPPNTPYYSDTGLATQAGTVSAYTTAVYVNGTYGSITVDSVTYYVDWTAAVRGYYNTAVAAYTLDRWMANINLAILPGDEYTSLISSVNNRYMYQILESIPRTYWGKQFTFSAMIRCNTGTCKLILGMPSGASREVWVNPSDKFALAQVSFVAEQAEGAYYFRIVNSNASGVFTQIDVVAVKVELGGISTLAYQDKDGNWVLNDPPPDPGEALAKCQRYFQVYSEEDKRPALAMDCRPVMRIDPTPLTLNINGQTCYANSAEL